MPLHELRQALMITQRDLAEHLNVNQPAICKNVDDVDEAYRCTYAKIVSTLLAKGNVKETLEIMDVNIAKEVASRIVELLDKLKLDQSPA